MFEAPYSPPRSCPNCESTLSNVQGVATCLECAWIDCERESRPR